MAINKILHVHSFNASADFRPKTETAWKGIHHRLRSDYHCAGVARQKPWEGTMKALHDLLALGIRASLALAAAALFAVASMPALAQAPNGIPGVLAPGVAPDLVQEGFVFTEGPVGTADGSLYFSDIRPNQTFHLDPAGKILLFRENTNGANGLALTRDGELLFAEGGGKRITKRAKDGSITTVTEGPPGVPLLAPNDLLVDGKGGIYFTDPGPRPVVPGRPTYLYYLASGARAPILLDGSIARPNGLTLTGDGRTLIVDDTLNATVFAYDVQPDGSVKNKRPFAQLRDIPAGTESGADGMAIDRDDRLYITTVTGVQVFDAKGQYLGTIKMPRQPANAAFAGPDKQTLYVTAREGLYRLRTLAKGPDRLGK
jgi:gluconolactonase